MKILGVILILAGILALAYGGFTYTTHKRAVDMGPLQIETKKRHQVFIPPVLGICGIVLGGALVFMAKFKSSLSSSAFQPCTQKALVCYETCKRV